MRQAGGDLYLALKPLETDDGAEVGPEHLDGNSATVPDVGGEVHGGHAALAKLALDDVAIRDSGAKAFEEVSHQSEGRRLMTDHGGSSG
jgi:hypothetical protein